MHKEDCYAQTVGLSDACLRQWDCLMFVTIPARLVGPPIVPAWRKGTLRVCLFRGSVSNVYCCSLERDSRWRISEKISSCGCSWGGVWKGHMNMSSATYVVGPCLSCLVRM